METTNEMIAIGNKIRRAKKKTSYYAIKRDLKITPVMMRNIEDGCHCSAATLLKVCEYFHLKVEIKRINSEEGD